MLIEAGLFGKIDRVKESVQFLKDLEPPDGYWLAFSGGKDSLTIYELAKMAGVKFEAHYNFTTIDPPELVQFIRDNYPDVKIDHPKKSFFKLVEEKGYPTRQGRWCCSELKERSGDGRKVVTGIRKQESVKRSKRKAVEFCYKRKSTIYINPIIDWLESDVWDFIRMRRMRYCSLYDQGWTRIGCLFCPMAGKERRLYEAQKYPKYVRAFIRAFDRRLIVAQDRKLGVANRFTTGQDMWDFWINERPQENIDQTVMFE